MKGLAASASGNGIEETTSPQGYTKAEMKFLKRFCGKLLSNADDTWEDHERAKLLVLMQQELQLSERKLLRFVTKYDEATPDLLACLGDVGVELQTSSLLQLFKSFSQDMICRKTEEYCESGLLSPDDLGDMTMLYDIVAHRLDNEDVTRLIRVLCGFCKTKAICGRMINVFTAHLSEFEIVSFVKNLLGYEVIADVEGPVKDLLKEIQSLSDVNKSEIMNCIRLDQSGNIIESDEDEEGNLKDFVCDDDDVSYDSEYSGSTRSGSEGSEAVYSDWMEDDEESAVISKIKHGESNARIHKNVNRSRTNRDRDKDLPIDEGRVSSKKRKRSLAYEPPLASMKKLKSKRDIETNATESHDDVVSAFDSDEADRQFSGHAEGSKKKRKGKNSRIIVCSSEEEEDF